MGVLVMLVATLGYALATRDSHEVQSRPAMSPSAEPPAERSPTPEPAEPDPVVEGSFNKKDGWSVGERLTFGVVFLDFPDDDCATHTYTRNGKTRGAFRSDCSSWEPEYDILLFRVYFENTSDLAATLVLRNLVLTDRYGNTYAPVNVRSHAEYPPYFLNERQQLPPGGKWSGWVTFDGRVVALVPARLSYIEGDQTLIQVFEGRHRVAKATR